MLSHSSLDDLFKCFTARYDVGGRQSILEHLGSVAGCVCLLFKQHASSVDFLRS